jgi:enoyl-CoA hydratase
MTDSSGDVGKIDLELRGSMALIRLARPEKLNALSRQMKQQLRCILDELEDNRDVRALILTGAGGRAFCAGTDIADLALLDEHNAKEFAEEGQQLGDRLEHFPVPVIAAINGIAAGGGTELALGCHLRLASRNAQLSLPEIKLGIIPGYGGTQRVMRVIGVGRALEMILTGKSISAEEAERLGLVNRVVEPERLIGEAESLASQIAQFSPLAIRACLRAVVQGRELPLEKGLALERELFGPLFATEDMHEGTRAFLEKRKPTFRGR